jgi:hypothetical protein
MPPPPFLSLTMKVAATMADQVFQKHHLYNAKQRIH